MFLTYELNYTGKNLSRDPVYGAGIPGGGGNDQIHRYERYTRNDQPVANQKKPLSEEPTHSKIPR